MTLSTATTDKARAEAANWFARLNKQDVPAADMEAFRVWRKGPGHKEAYDEVDAFWRRSAALKSDPRIQEAMAAALKSDAPAKGRLRFTTRPVLGLGLALGLMVLLGAGAYKVFAPHSYSTSVGEQRSVRLADGSTMTLDTASQASVKITAKRRDIRLTKGQALFEVAHDAARPFVVSAGATSVTALGTRFEVRRELQGATVTLVRGAVEVREKAGQASRTWRLAPGQRVATASALARATAVDVASATSWTRGRLEFHDVPLRDAVAEFNRYERRRIQLAPGPWDSNRISGIFNVDDTQTFVDSVAELHDLKVSQSDNGVIRLTRAGDGDAAR